MKMDIEFTEAITKVGEDVVVKRRGPGLDV